MADNTDFFSSFEAHTLLKHAILNAYVERWARKLLLRSGAGTKVRIVDACAGRGSDESGNPGSPLIAAQVAKAAEQQLSELRGEAVFVEIVAIEESASNFAALKTSIQQAGANVLARRGTLADYIAEFDADARWVPTLFFIDPFGLAPLRAEVIRRALSGPRNEALMLFADQAALRHFGATAAAAPQDDRESPQTSLFADVGTDHGRGSVAKTASRAALETTARAAEQILNAAFEGIDWRERINAVPREQRRHEFLKMYRELLRSMGAGYVLPIPVLDVRTHMKYHLFHASRSEHGYVTMKDAVERAWKNTPELGGRAVDCMRLLAKCDLDAVASRIVKHFSGRTVRWTDDGTIRGVKSYALSQTLAYPHHMPDLQSKLDQYRQPGKMIVYRFP